MRISLYIKMLGAVLITASAFAALDAATVKEMNREAQESRDNRDLKKAINLWLSALEIEPDNERIQQQIEEVYESKLRKDNLFEYSKKNYRDARKKLKDDDDRIVLQGIIAGEKSLNDYAEASRLDLYDEELKNKREDMKILEQDILAAKEKLRLSREKREKIAFYKNLAREEMKKRYPDYQMALYYWDQILDIASNDSEALEGKRKCRLALEDRLKSDRIQGYLLSGINYFNKKEYPAAKREFEEVRNLDKKHQEAQDYIDNINEILEGKRQLAQKEEQAESFYQSGINNANNNRFDAARDDFETSLSLVKDYKDSRQRIKDLERRKKEYDERERANRLKKIDQKFQEGLVAYSQGKYRKARDAFQTTLELDSKHTLAKDFLEKTLDALRLEEEEVADENSPLFPFIYSDILAGRILYEKADYAGSRKCWERILNLRPKNKIARENIIKCDIKIDPNKGAGTLAELFQEGKDGIAKKEYRDALSSLSIIKSIDTKYPGLDNLIAEANRGLKESRVVNVSVADKVDSERLYRESLALQEKGGKENFEKALERLRLVYRKDPNNTNALILYSRIETRLSTGGGEAERRKVLNADQRERVNKFMISGIRYMQQYNYLKAIREFDRVLEIEPGNVRALSNRSIIKKQLTRIQ